MQIQCKPFQDRLDELVKEAERDKENDITRHPPTKVTHELSDTGARISI